MNTKLTNGTLRDGQAFHVRYLIVEDIPIILNLQEKVKHALQSPATLEPLSKEEFNVILSGHELMIGVFIEEKIIAFRAMLDPEVDDEHLGIDAGLLPEELPKVIYSEISSVDPDYRGNGLQMYMGKLLMKRIDVKRFQYVCATVAPLNIPSLKDKLSLGLKIVALKEKYGGKLRYILIKDLTAKPEDTLTDETFILSTDITEQQKVLEAGFRGVSIKEENKELYIGYCRV
ncbi:GNAT family N-acetyltransferase [Virgibacillus necropolis]|uniref:N-acetyltransferase n=1 Tax=Virgibacillus necropolis TaxID=163877 RepID=A0A221MEQ2_9BACI|nr:hypothetical protein [Virgibacillus necropolis]ASN06049.1 N-acetyltransferase [Virgibacillus necropolis]